MIFGNEKKTASYHQFLYHDIAYIQHHACPNHSNQRGIGFNCKMPLWHLLNIWTKNQTGSIMINLSLGNIIYLPKNGGFLWDMQTLNRLIFMDFVPLWYDTTSWAQWTLCYFHSVNILFYIRSAKAVKLYVLSAMLFTIFHPFLWCLIKWFEYSYIK